MNANDFLMGGGSKSAKFPTPGTSVSGPIVAEPKVTQQTDFTTREPKTWPNGDPMMQLVVDLQTDQRDETDTEDDGIRSVYIKGKSLTNAVREAVRAAGAKGLEVGGKLTVTYTSNGPAERGMAPKLYAATYAPPAAGAAAAQFLGTNEPAGDMPAGMNPTLWAQMEPEQRAQVLAAMANTR